MTIVASFHEIELARLLADQLLTVKDGHAQHIGTPAEIFREEIIAPLYDISAEEFRLLYGRAEDAEARTPAVNRYCRWSAEKIWCVGRVKCD